MWISQSGNESGNQSGASRKTEKGSLRYYAIPAETSNAVRSWSKNQNIQTEELEYLFVTILLLHNHHKGDLWQPGVNPTIASYNASAVNFYNATGSIARFENKNILFYFENRCRLLQRWSCRCKLKNRRIGSRYGLLFYATSLVTCKQGLVALAPHIEILKLSIPCVVGHLPGIIHTILSSLANM
jgi:hypothetical protein